MVRKGTENSQPIILHFPNPKICRPDLADNPNIVGQKSSKYARRTAGVASCHQAGNRGRDDFTFLGPFVVLVDKFSGFISIG
jgi:hypothetical protein